ncbi:MAG TPA: hypothetical protein VIM96_08615 [Pseudomonadales bacterium]
MKLLKALLSSILIIAISLFLFELVGQKMLFKGQLYIVDNVDHRMPPNAEDRINSDGIRSDREAVDFHADNLNIVFLGDSFVFGMKLPPEESVPALLEKKARALHPDKNVQVANFGWVSSSPLLSYRLLKDIGKKYKPDVVILAVDMTDIHDDIKYTALLERQGIYPLLDYTPVSVLAARQILQNVGSDAVYEQVFGFPKQRFFATARPLSETRPYFAAIQNSIDAINAYVQDELGAQFVLLIFPRGYQYSTRETPHNWEAAEYEPMGPYVLEPFVFFDALKAQAPYPVFSLLPDFQHTDVFPTTFDDDPHWTPEGSQVAADAVYRYCLQAGCFD